MIYPPAVIVHGLADACAALAPGRPVTLLSAPGAGGFAGCLWWLEMVAAARARHPRTEALAILDCAAAPGRAMEALRLGVQIVVLSEDCPAFRTVAGIAATQGARVLGTAPPALDLADPAARRRLAGWLGGTDTPPCPPARPGS